MRVVVITPPAPVLSVEDVKAHLKLETGDDDAYLEGAIAAAVGHLDGPDGWLGRALGLQTLELRTDHFETADPRGAALPYPPIVNVVSVQYLDSAGVVQTVAPEGYELRGNRLGLSFGASWPSYRSHTESVRITYDAGYPELPKAIRWALLLIIGDLYKFRETVVTGTIASQIPMSAPVESLLSPFRVFR